MPRHVLVPVDGSVHSFGGLEYCLQSFPDATVTAVYVVDPAHDHEASVGSSASTADSADDYGERVLDRAVDHAEQHDREIQTYLRTGTPHTELLAIANTDVDHVVMGSHGESPIVRPFLGRVSEAVVRRSPVTTTVVPEPATDVRDRELPGTVLVPLDGSEQAEAALAYALETFPDGEFTAFHALSLPFDRPRDDVQGTYLEEIMDDRERRAEAIFESAQAIADEHDVSLETETDGDSPSNAIVEYADENDYDQIVMGSHGRSLAARLVTGTVAERVARRSPQTVTLVRGAPTED
ncbi:universal stress protein [Natronolimnohabitans sp. A-GB9]|uniref:universal stress protein n=1 Tax=Natronolimnohabitans sp. A-GB9 TaxID=3069757 RepID=UPI0027B6B867|nr:universal stress protein [Natronolimnohabitans sp. A-GB9]MDQ2052568.1 universal stress protein [Natronolimnohabitans sp. A-GB9]